MNIKNFKNDKKNKKYKITAELILASIEEVQTETTFYSTFLGPVSLFLLRLVNSFCMFITL